MSIRKIMAVISTRNASLSTRTMSSNGAPSPACAVRQRPLARFFAIVVVFTTALGSVGCDTSPGESLYDETRDFAADPVVDRIEPASALAGIGTLTIFGQNFSSDPSENLVYFGDQQAEVIEATPTEIVVNTPNLPGDEINVRVTVIGAETFSNPMAYRLDPAVEEFGDITDFEEVFGIATDAEGDLYMSLFSSNVSAGIKRLNAEGERSDYVSSTFQWNDLDFDSEGYLYGVRNVRAVFRFPPGGGGAAETWAVADDAAARFRAIAVDENDNVWVGGGGANVYRITPDAAFTPSSVDATVTSMEISDGFLYLGFDSDPGRVGRFDIQQDGTLGSEQVVFTAPAGVDILSLAIGEGGEVLVGTDGDDPLYIVHADGTTNVFYTGLLDPSASKMAWGTGSELYMVRGRTASTTPDLIRINTPFQGAP